MCPGQAPVGEITFSLTLNSPYSAKKKIKKKEKSLHPKPFSVAVIINLIHLMASFSLGKKQIIVCRASLLGHCTFNL